MPDLNPPAPELRPHVLYCREGDGVRLATWRLQEGHEALALFTSPDAAATYQGELLGGSAWTVFQPPREALVDILKSCRDAGILYAALDPLGGQARTLFDIPRVLAAADRAGGA